MLTLSGFDGFIVNTPQEALDRVKMIRRSKDYSMLIITERALSWVFDIVNQIRASKSSLIILDIPDKQGHIETGKSLADFIREAVGIKV